MRAEGLAISEVDGYARPLRAMVHAWTADAARLDAAMRGNRARPAGEDPWEGASLGRIPPPEITALDGSISLRYKARLLAGADEGDELLTSARAGGAAGVEEWLRAASAQVQFLLRVLDELTLAAIEGAPSAPWISGPIAAHVGSALDDPPPGDLPLGMPAPRGAPLADGEARVTVAMYGVGDPDGTRDRLAMALDEIVPAFGGLARYPRLVPCSDQTVRIVFAVADSDCAAGAAGYALTVALQALRGVESPVAASRIALRVDRRT